MLNAFQRICAGAYANGDFAGVMDIEAARAQGDTLFTFLMIELSSNEGCDSRTEAIRRLEMASANIEEVPGAVASRQELPAEEQAVPIVPVETVTLRFTPLAWIRDYAVTVDDEGPATWEVPRALLLERFPLEKDWLEQDEERDAMRFEGNAPAWIRDWTGPFEVDMAQPGVLWAPEES